MSGKFEGGFTKWNVVSFEREDLACVKDIKTYQDLRPLVYTKPMIWNQ